MNTLSWLFYFADVAGAADGFLGTFTYITGFLALVVFAFGIGLTSVIVETGNSTTEEDIKSVWNIVAAVQKFMLPMFFAIALLGFMVPEKQTIMLIAASEAGETILTSDPAKELGGAAMDTLSYIRDYIKTQLPKVDTE